MTIYDFFINQNVKQIQEACREKTWFETFHNVPGDLKAWCKLFKLDEDERVTNIYIYDGRGQCELTVYIDFDFGPIIGKVNWGVEFAFTGRNKKVKVSFNGFINPHSTGNPEVFHDKYLPGTVTDEDKRYCDLGYDVPLAMFADSNRKKEDCNDYYPIYDESNSPNVYVERIKQFLSDIGPFMQEFYDSLYNGEFAKQWAKFHVDPPVNGNMTNSGLLGPGMRGIVNVRYWAKFKRGVELSQEDVICLTCRGPHSADGGWGRQYKSIHPAQDDILDIMFMNRGCVNKTWDDLTAERLKECLEACRKAYTIDNNLVQTFKDEFKEVCERIWDCFIDPIFGEDEMFVRLDKGIVASAICKKLMKTFPVKPGTECSFNDFDWTGAIPESYIKNINK